jgi:excisionase family DNA binding protein
VHQGFDRWVDPVPAGEYTIAEAAQVLGVHPNTIRRWLRKGRLPSRMAEGPGGQEHHIPVQNVNALASRSARPGRPRVDHGSTTAGDVVAPVSDDGQTTADREDRPESDRPFNHSSAEAEPSSGAVPTDLQPVQRAREMAEYTERLLEPWRRRVEEQAELVGRLKTELEQAREQIAAFEAVTVELEREQQAAAAGAVRRPWWRFW